MDVLSKSTSHTPPYRSSPLTYLLRSALYGSTPSSLSSPSVLLTAHHTVFIGCVSPMSDSVAGTVQVLKTLDKVQAAELVLQSKIARHGAKQAKEAKATATKLRVRQVSQRKLGLSLDDDDDDGANLSGANLSGANPSPNWARLLSLEIESMVAAERLRLNEEQGRIEAEEEELRRERKRRGIKASDGGEEKKKKKKGKEPQDAGRAGRKKEESESSDAAGSSGSEDSAVLAISDFVDFSSSVQERIRRATALKREHEKTLETLLADTERAEEERRVFFKKK